MRVLIVGERIREDVGSGIEVYEYNLIKELSKIAEIRKIDVFEPISAEKKGPLWLFKLRYLFEQGMKRLFFNPIKLGYSWSKIKNWHPDIIHCLKPILFPPLFFITQKPTIITFYDTFQITQSKYMLSKYYAFLQSQWFRFATKMASHIIVISNKTKEELVNHFKIPIEKISVVEIAQSDKFLKQKPKKYLKGKKRYILGYFSAFTPSKRPELAIEIFKKLKEKYPQLDVELHMYGSAFGENLLKQLQENPKKDVKILGFAPETKKVHIYKSFDILLFPSLYEGFGLPILEASSLGIPVISMKDAKIPPEVKKATIEVKNSEDAADEIYKYLKDIKKWNKISKDNMDYARKNFSWEKTAQKTLEVYEKLKNG